MIKNAAQAFALIILAAPLGGCSSFFGINLSRATPELSPAVRGLEAPQKTADVRLTDVGREHLAAGNSGLAIDAFQRALANGESVAPALNGLGVGYARIGRFDLAYRYFQQASSADPTDARYSDNLALLIRSPAFALRREKDMIDVALRAEAPAEVDVNTASPGRIERLSRGEVRIRTVAEPNSGQTRRADVDRRFNPIVRIGIASKSSEPQSFVRIEFADVGSKRAQ